MKCLSIVELRYFQSAVLNLYDFMDVEIGKWESTLVLKAFSSSKKN